MFISVLKWTFSFILYDPIQQLIYHQEIKHNYIKKKKKYIQENTIHKKDHTLKDTIHLEKHRTLFTPYI